MRPTRPRWHAPDRGSRRGFSLIELMTVIVILGMMGAIVMVSWEALFPKTKLHAAVRNLSEHLASARSEAISRNAVFEIHYQIDENRYWVRSPYRLGGGFATEEEESRAILNETDLEEAGLDIVQVTIDDQEYADGQVFVRFDPLGASSAHTVQLHHPSFDAWFTLEVLPLTGEIRFHEGAFEREMPRDGEFD